MSENQQKMAGNFSTWLQAFIKSQKNKTGMQVECGDCICCCMSFYFIHITPDDKEALAHIPKELLFPAPGLKDHFVMGFDENGKCPMLQDEKCAIYKYRPLTCRQYDCRIFPASGLNLDGDEKPILNELIKRWQFNFTNNQDHIEYEAVHQAAIFLQKNAELFPKGFLPGNTTQLAVLAILVYEVFIKQPGETGQLSNKKIVDNILKIMSKNL